MNTYAKWLSLIANAQGWTDETVALLMREYLLSDDARATAFLVHLGQLADEENASE